MTYSDLAKCKPVYVNYLQIITTMAVHKERPIEFIEMKSVQSRGKSSLIIFKATSGHDIRTRKFTSNEEGIRQMKEYLRESFSDIPFRIIEYPDAVDEELERLEMGK